MWRTHAAYKGSLASWQNCLFVVRRVDRMTAHDPGKKVSVQVQLLHTPSGWVHYSVMTFSPENDLTSAQRRPPCELPCEETFGHSFSFCLLFLLLISLLIRPNNAHDEGSCKVWSSWKHRLMRKWPEKHWMKEMWFNRAWLELIRITWMFCSEIAQQTKMATNGKDSAECNQK